MTPLCHCEDWRAYRSQHQAGWLVDHSVQAGSQADDPRGNYCRGPPGPRYISYLP